MGLCIIISKKVKMPKMSLGGSWHDTVDVLIATVKIVSKQINYRHELTVSKYMHEKKQATKK